MPKHKHYDVIVAAAEGKDIQRKLNGEWVTYSGESAMMRCGFNPNNKYRVAPVMVECWRWAIETEDGHSIITRDHYPSREAVLKSTFGSSRIIILEKLESTKGFKEFTK